MKTLTRRGAVLLGVGATTLALGAALASWLAGGAGLACLVAVALAWLEGGATRVSVEREVGSTILTEGARTSVALRIHADRPRRARLRETIPAGLAVVEGASEIDTQLPATLVLGVEARAPGRWRVGPLLVTFSDALGLVEERSTVEGEAIVRAYPRVEPLRDVPLASRMSLPLAGQHATGQSGPGADFYALRAYQEGDTMRDVNWRASARTAKGLVVNQREKESQAFVTFFVDTRAVAGVGTPDANAWIDAARAFASLAAHASRRRDRPRIVLYGDSVHGPVALRAGDAALTSALDAILDSPPSGASGLDDAVAHALPTLRPNAPVVVVSSLLGDDTVATAAASLRALGQHVTAIAIDPGAHLEASATAPATRERAMAARRRRMDALRTHGARVVEWDAREPLGVALAREAIR